MDTNVKQAVDTLRAALKNDPEYFMAWQANIAMAVLDEFQRGQTSYDRYVTNTEMHLVCNAGAVRFLNLLCEDRPKVEQPAESAPVNLQPPLPTTLDDAVAYLLPRFGGMEKYLENGEDYFASFCHSQMSGGIGMKVRNELQLWIHESPLHQYFLSEHNLFHPDEMSDLIIRRIYHKLQPETQDGK